MIDRGIIALDADGVLLDYGLAYAGAWQKAFGTYPAEKDPLAYWPLDRWDVERLIGERLEQFRRCFDEEFWASIPAMAGAIEACKLLRDAGYQLVCVTALPDRLAKARRDNLLALSFPIEVVHTVDHVDAGVSPKADVLHGLKPLAFVDDYLPYLVGIDSSIHRALILRGENKSPNTGDHLRYADSRHPDLLSFARWWLAEGSDNIARARHFRPLLAGLRVHNCAGELSFDVVASPAKGSFRQPWGVHSPGQKEPVTTVRYGSTKPSTSTTY